jgi:hypothetical protein
LSQPKNSQPCAAEVLWNLVVCEAGNVMLALLCAKYNGTFKSL